MYAPAYWCNSKPYGLFSFHVKQMRQVMIRLQDSACDEDRAGDKNMRSRNCEWHTEAVVGWQNNIDAQYNYWCVCNGIYKKNDDPRPKKNEGMVSPE